MLSFIYILLAIIAVFVVLVSMQATDFRITRVGRITAPVSIVFPHVSDMHKWAPWSPWAKLDPNQKVAFEGPASGPDAVMKWSGNNKVGEGKMTVLTVSENEFIQFKLEFYKPMTATNMAEFTFAAEGPETIIAWSTYGKNGFMAKFVSLFMNCDKMVGDQFEQGLANLKALIESHVQQGHA